MKTHAVKFVESGKLWCGRQLHVSAHRAVGVEAGSLSEDVDCKRCRKRYGEYRVRVSALSEAEAVCPACFAAESEGEHASDCWLAAALASPPPDETRLDDEKRKRDSQPRYSQIDIDTATKPLHAEIERLKAAQAPPSDPPGLKLSEVRKIYRDARAAWRNNCAGDLRDVARGWVRAEQDRRTIAALRAELAARPADPPGLVDLVREWQDAERAWGDAEIVSEEHQYAATLRRARIARVRAAEAALLAYPLSTR